MIARIAVSNAMVRIGAPMDRQRGICRMRGWVQATHNKADEITVMHPALNCVRSIFDRKWRAGPMMSTMFMPQRYDKRCYGRVIAKPN